MKEAKEWTNLLESWHFERPDPNLESSKVLSSGKSAHKSKKMSTHFWGFRHRETSNQQRKFKKQEHFERLNIKKLCSRAIDILNKNYSLENFLGISHKFGLLSILKLMKQIAISKFLKKTPITLRKFKHSAFAW